MRRNVILCFVKLWMEKPLKQMRQEGEIIDVFSGSVEMGLRLGVGRRSPAWAVNRAMSAAPLRPQPSLLELKLLCLSTHTRGSGLDVIDCMER